MSVIIRLQNLPWSANALDIRTFFRGLSIPDGGVHIVGGEMGDAFIAFSTDEDARQAMMLDGKKLKEVQIKLLLSSRAEMQKVIETARQTSMNMLQIPTAQKSSQAYKASQKTSAPQPPSITSSSLGHNLPQQSAAALNINENSSQSYQSNMALLSQNDNSADSRESRVDSAQMSRYKKLQTNDRHRNFSRSHSRSRSSSRSRTRDRRRSRSRDRDRNTRRRERSRSIERHDRRRHSSSQENSRDRDYENSRDGVKRVTDKKSALQDNLNTYTEKSNLGSMTQKSEITDAKSNPISVWNLAAKLPQNQVAYSTPSAANSFPTNLNQLQSMGQLNFAAFASMMPPHLQQQQQFMLNHTQNPQLNQFGMQAAQKQIQKDNPYTFPMSQMRGLNEQQQLQNSLNMVNANHPMMQKQDDARSQMPFQTGYNMQQFQQFGARNMPKPANEAGNFNNQREKVFDSQTLDLRDSKRSRNSPRRDHRDHRRRSRSPPGKNHSPQNYSNKRSRDPRDRGDVNYDAIEGNCIKISNMCPSTSYSELRRFFSGLHIANNGIKMINGDNGERIGVAYVQFVKKESKPKAFIRNNAVFKKQRVVIESVTEDEFIQAIDSFKPERPQTFPSRHERSPTKSDSEKRGNKGSDSEPGKEKEKEEGYSCLFLQDLPPFAKEQDVIKMFSSYVLFDILLTREKDCRRQYVCYVKFHRPEDAKNALEDSSKHKIAHKHILISPCSDEDFEKAKEKYTTREEASPDQQEKEKDQRMPGSGNDLSPDRTEITEVTMTDSFGPLKTEDNSLKGALKNLAETSNQFNKDPRQPMTAPNDPRRRGTRFSRPDDNKNKTKFAILRNCDFKATEKDFENFFTELGITPNQIHILTNNRHQPTGECIIEFHSTEDAEKSLYKNNALFGSRTVRVELITEKNVTDRLNENFIEPEVAAQVLPEEHIQMQQPESASFDRAIQDQIINYICSQYGNDILGNSQQENAPPAPQMDVLPNPSIQEDHNMQQDLAPRSNPFRNNHSNMNNMNSKENSRGNANQGQGNTRRHGRPSRFSDADNSMSNKNRNAGNINNRPQNIVAPELNNSTVDTFGKPGCVVGMENVPFKADTNDILEFFREFNIHPRNVIRRYNDDGTPTGDARVAFSSPMEARAAIEQKRLQKIFNRTIYLALV